MNIKTLKSLIKLVNENPKDFVLNVRFDRQDKNTILHARHTPVRLANLQDMYFVKIRENLVPVDNIVSVSIIANDPSKVEYIRLDNEDFEEEEWWD